MNFIKKVQNSIYSPEFYSKVPKQSFGTALKYFLLLALLFTVLRSIAPVYDFITGGQKEIDKFVSQAGDIYPSELSVKIQNGKVSTNVEEPYLVPFPGGAGEQDMQNLVVIDTKTPFSAAQFHKYQALAWVTEDSVFVRDDNKGQFRTIDLSNAENLTVDKELVDSFIAKASPWLKLITPVVIVAILSFMFISNMFMLVSLLFTAILILLILKIVKTPLTYGESYKVGMYALTLGFFVDFVKETMQTPGFPFMHTTITLLVVLFNFLSVKKPSKAKK